MRNGNTTLEAAYERGHVLGRGASGVAFIVRPKSDPQLQLVAKEICILPSEDKRRREAIAESQLLRTLAHKNIVACLDVVLDHEMMYIVMEYADGGDLSRTIQSHRTECKRIAENSVMKVFVQMCLALQYLHFRKILHRDLKPANIFVLGEGDLGNCTIKLGDFGIAKMIDCTMGQAHSTVGTPSYLAPEICKNNPYGMKADIWSLGVVLYELTCLKVPFQAGNLPAMAWMICTSDPKPLPDEYSTQLDDLVKLLLNKDPVKRPHVSAFLQHPYVQSFLSEEQRGMGTSENLAQTMPDLQTSHARGGSVPNRRNRTADSGTARLPSCGPSARAKTEARPDKYIITEDASQWCWRREADAERPERPTHVSTDRTRIGVTPGAGSVVNRHVRRGERVDAIQKSPSTDVGERADRTEYCERSELDHEVTDQAERADRADGNERVDRHERGDRVKKAERAERSDRLERSDRAWRVERADRERIDRSDQGSRADRTRGAVEDRGRACRGSRGSDQGVMQIDKCGSECWVEQGGRLDTTMPPSAAHAAESLFQTMSDDITMESVATPENSGLADADEDLVAGGRHEPILVAEALPPAHMPEPAPPDNDPPSSSRMLTALHLGASDAQQRARHRIRRRGRPPHDLDLRSPTRTQPSRRGQEETNSPGEAQATCNLQSSHSTPSISFSASAPLAQLIARSVSPSRSAAQCGGGLTTSSASSLRLSGSAPSLPPLPPVLAQTRGISRSRSSLAALAPPQQLPPPPPLPPPRQVPRDESGVMRLAPMLPATIVGQSESCHWREAVVGSGRAETSTMGESRGDAVLHSVV